MVSFKTTKLHVDNLLLDPSNPRLKTDCAEREIVQDAAIRDLQEQLMTKFRLGRPNQDSEDEFFDINSLARSMKTIGYVSIDRMVVRPIASHPSRFVVIEGNRRLATLKKLRQLHDDEDEEWTCDSDEIRDTLDEIEVMVLKTEGVPESEWRHNANIILGIRHHGSLLEWAPLAEAYNLYKEYRRLHPVGERFSFHNQTIKKVSALLAVPFAKVKNALKTYIAYLQLKEYDARAVKNHHYSLIEALITNNRLMGVYLQQDPGSYEISDATVERMFKLCQFSVRDTIREDENILRRPQSANRLAKIVDAYINNHSEAVRNRATSLLNALEAGEPGMTAETGADLITAFIDRQEWAQTILKYLKQREEKLSFDAYNPVGNDRLRKDELWGRVRQLQTLIQHIRQ